MSARIDPGELARARRALGRRDPVLGRAMRRVGPCRLENRGDPYRSLVRSVMFQQLAGPAARAIHARFVAPYRGRIPRPGVVLAAPDAELRAVGLSRQKIATIRAVASAFEDGTLSSRRLRRMSEQEVIEAVTLVRGIGEWTAHMLLIFSLGRLDVLPVGDYGVRKGAMQLYGLSELPDRRQLEEIGERWRPYRSVASWYLWRVADTRPPG